MRGFGCLFFSRLDIMNEWECALFYRGQSILTIYDLKFREMEYWFNHHKILERTEAKIANEINC